MATPDSGIDALVTRIEASGVLGQASRLPHLLRYLLEEERMGRGERIKAFSIATDVLGRRADFDPQTSSIVRVEIARLRHALDLYFATSGPSEPVHIAIPKGSYRPVLLPRADHARAAEGEILPGHAAPPQSSNARHGRMTGGILLAGALILAAVLFFRPSPAEPPAQVTAALPRTHVAANSVGLLMAGPVSDTAEGRAFSENLWANILSSARTKLFSFHDLHAFNSVAEGADGSQSVEHMVTVRLTLPPQTEPAKASLNVVLSKARNAGLIWSEILPVDYPASPLAMRALAQRAIADVFPHLVEATRQELRRRAPEQLSPIEQFILATWIPGGAENSLEWERHRLLLAEAALASDPKFGPAHSVLADKLAYLANYLPEYDTPESQARASRHAQMALELSSEDPSSVFNVALHFWHRGNHDEATRLMGRVLALNPADRLAQFFVRAMPWTCSALTDKGIEEFIGYDEEFSSDNPTRWVTKGWIARLYLNSGQAEAAQDYATAANDIFRSLDATLLNAAIAAHQKSPAAAAASLKPTLELWPGLSVAHYVTKALPRRCASPAGQKLARYYTSLLEGF